MAELGEEQRLHRLPSARSALHAHVSEERAAPHAMRNLRRIVVPPHSVRSIRRANVRRYGQATGQRADFAILPTGRTASPKASYRRRNRAAPGFERNIVVTTWDWLNEKNYLHDLIASDRRFPTVNAYGPVYGSTEYSTDVIPVLDPVKTTLRPASVAPVRDDNIPEALGPACGERQTHAAVALLGRREDLGLPRRTIITA